MDDSTKTYTSISQIPDRLFTGGELYGVWQVDSVKTLSGHYYKGGSIVQIAFTNDGQIFVENKNNTELNHEDHFAPDWKISPWYFSSGNQPYQMKTLQPSNEISVQEGYPLTATLDFTENKEHWTGHFSNNKIWLYQWASGNAQVHIWANKVK